MKRSQALRNLSSDHHRALVVARKARNADLETHSSVEKIWKELEDYYKAELENHLAKEERHVVPHLLTAGYLELVERLKKEHKEIRGYFVPEASRTADALQNFAKLLEQHVRFEERELFNAVQESLSPEVLALIEENLKK